jgi:hypothetical protein
MKTLKISDPIHSKLTAIVGQLMAESGKSKTYEDAIAALLGRSVVLPPELLSQIGDFIAENKALGYKTKEEFLKDAARFRIENLQKNKTTKQQQ